MSMVIPYLPPEGNAAAREWISRGKAAFVKSYQVHPGACRNCQDIGVIYLVRTESGPYKTFVPAGKGQVVAWYDGNEQFGKGWYLISDTLAYECPECKKMSVKQPTRDYDTYIPIKELAARMQALKRPKKQAEMPEVEE